MFRRVSQTFLKEKCLTIQCALFFIFYCNHFFYIVKCLNASLFKVIIRLKYKVYKNQFHIWLIVKTLNRKEKILLSNDTYI